MADAKYLLVETTVGTTVNADKLASLILESRLAACVQVVPDVKSKYFWQGKIEESTELVVRMKTRLDKYEALESLLLANHSYEIPEIIAFKVKKVAPGYAEWLDAELDR